MPGVTHLTNQSQFIQSNANFAGTNISGTINSSGISLSVAPSGGADGYNILAAGTQTANTTGTILFSNSNGLTFGMSNSSVITASHNGITSQTVQPVAVSGSNGSFSFSTLTFGNSNGLSFYTTNGSMVGSYTVPTVTNSSATVSAGTTSGTIGNLVFSNSNGVSFGLNAGTITATVKTDYLTSQSNQAFSADASSTFQTLVFQDSNGVSFSNNAGSLRITHALQFTSNTSAITSNALHTTSPRINVSAGTTSNNLSALTFSNANGITFGLNASTITASHNGLTTAAQSNQVVNSLNGSTGQISLNVGSSLSASTNGSSITFGLASNITTALQSANANYLTSQSNQAVSGANGSFTFQTITFANSNGISFSTGTQGLYASHNGLTTARASNDAIGLNTAGTNVTWTVNSSGLSLNASGYAGTGTTFNGTNVSGSITQNSNGIRIDLSAGAGGGASPVASASNGSFSFTTLAFSNANNVTFGTSAGSIITASVAAPGAAAENNWVNLLGANTAGNTTASGSTLGLSGINLTLSGTNNSVINISAPATSSIVGAGNVSISSNGSTVSISGVERTLGNWEVFPQGNNSTFSSMGQNSFYLQKLVPQSNYSFNNFELRMSGSFVSSSNSQVAAHSMSYGLYSLNGSTYSSIATSLMVISASFNSSTAYGITMSQGAGSYTVTSNNSNLASYLSGFKHLYLPFTSTITAGGLYAFGINISSATTVGTSPFRMALLNQTIVNNLTIGKVHASTILASNASFVGDFAMGVRSATTGGLPTSIGVSDLTNQVSQARLYIQLD